MSDRKDSSSETEWENLQLNIRRAGPFHSNGPYPPHASMQELQFHQ
jgi:hypothetical protein